MANEFVTINPYDDQLEKLRQRQRMADLLQQQALQPLESQVAPGGYAVRTSPVLGLAKMLQAYMGGREQRNIDKEMSGIRDRAMQDQRNQEAETASAAAGITGRLFGEKPTQYNAAGLPVTPRPTEASVAAPQPSGDSLEEITPTAKPMYDPTAALQQAMTPAGARAMQGNPMLASLLAQTMKPKEPEEFGTTPVVGKDGKYYLVSKSGRMVSTDVAGQGKEVTPTNFSKLIAERDALPANDPLRALYDRMIAKEATQSPGVTVNYGTPVAGVDDQGNPVFFQPSKEGGAPSIIPGIKPMPTALTDNESKSAVFADRMNISSPTLDSLPPVPINQQVAGAVPLVGNTLIDARSRQFKQAEENFITAVLRKESGAVIGADEYDREVKKYIPLVGDDPKTLEMKRKSREAALAGMIRSAGPSYKPATTSIQKAPAQNDPLGLR